MDRILAASLGVTARGRDPLATGERAAVRENRRAVRDVSDGPRPRRPPRPPTGRPGERGGRCRRWRRASGEVRDERAPSGQPPTVTVTRKIPALRGASAPGPTPRPRGRRCAGCWCPSGSRRSRRPGAQRSDRRRPSLDATPAGSAERARQRNELVLRREARRAGPDLVAVPGGDAAHGRPGGRRHRASHGASRGGGGDRVQGRLHGAAAGVGRVIERRSIGDAGSSDRHGQAEAPARSTRAPRRRGR